MQRTKKNRSLRVMVLVLMFTLISTCMLGGTMAKYTSEATGSDSARVAIWGFSGVNAVNIFTTTYDNVLSSDGTDVVAPGTHGSFSFGLASGVSEVTTDITFNLTETNTSNIPIVYEYSGSYYSSVLSGTVYLNLETGSFAAVTIAGNLAALNTALATSYTRIPAGTDYNTLTGGTVTWYWAFEQDAVDTTGANIAARDTSDTALGVSAAAGSAATVTLNAKLTAVQVD